MVSAPIRKAPPHRRTIWDGDTSPDDFLPPDAPKFFMTEEERQQLEADHEKQMEERCRLAELGIFPPF